MSDTNDLCETFDSWVYAENKSKIPLEELAKYAGQYVAWSLDGTRILAGSFDQRELFEILKAKGLNPQRAVYGYCDGPDDDSQL